MSKHLFRILFGTLCLVSASVFTGCSDDDEKSVVPELTASPETLTFSEETETVQTISVKANCEWTVVKTDLDWATVEPMSGKGDATITVSVSEMASGLSERSGKIAFSLIHPEFGKWGESESTVTVKQYASGVTPPPTGDPIYANNFDKEPAQKGSSGWDTWLDKFEGWKNETGTGIANVSYESSGASARTVGKDSASDMSDYEGSGVNNVFFGSNAYFTIGNLDLGGKRNLRLSFGTERYGQNDPDNTWNPAEFEIELSNNGTAWSKPITVNFAKGSAPVGRWDLAIADFTLPEGTSALYIRFTAKAASVYRIDDVTLAEGVGGQEITFEEGGDPEPGETVKTTIPELIEKCEAAGDKQQEIDAANDHVFEAVVVTDKQGGNTTALNLQLMTEGATTAGNGITLYGSGVYTDPSDDNFTFVAGDKVRVTLKAGEARVTTYSGLHEVTGSKNAAWVVIEKIGTATVTPVEITPDQIVAFQAMPVTIKNVTAPAAATWAGTKTFKVNGETDLTVYTQNGAPWAEQEFVGGATGDITGYAALYKGAPQIAPRNINDIAAFMGEPSTDPSITVNPTSLTFAAAGEAKTVTVTKKNADDCTIEASADNEQFTVEVSGDQVNVTAKENTAEEAISGTLTVKLMKAGEAVATATVALKQNGVSITPSGDGYVRVSTITPGKKYLIVAESSKNFVFDYSQFDKGKVNGVEIAVNDNVIESNATNDAYAVTIATSGNDYTIQTGDGSYVEYAGSSTNLSLSQEATRVWLASVTDKNTIKFTDEAPTSGGTVRCLLFQDQGESSFQRFGGYAEQNADNGEYVTVALYELNE